MLTTMNTQILRITKIALLLSIPLLAYFLIQNASMRVVNTVNHQIKMEINSIAYEQDSWISLTHQFLEVLSEVPVVSSGDSIKCSEFMAKVNRTLPRYANFGVIDLDGNVVCSAIPFSGRISESEKHNYIRETIATKDFSIGEYEIDAIAHKPTIDFGHEILDAKGNVKYVVFADLELGWMKNLFDQGSFPEQSVLLILDRNGLILYRNIDTENWVGKEIPDSEILRVVLESNTGTTDAIGPDGIRRIYAFTSLSGPSNDVFLIVGIPYSFVTSQTLMLFVQFATASVLAFIITVLFLKLRRKDILKTAQ
jgi:hypothetical protein